MIDSAPLAQFEPLAEGLLRPIYADYSFANIPATIHYLLTGERLRLSSPEGGSASELAALLPASCFGGAYPNPSKVVLFFIDSFGWKFWQEHQSRFKTTRRVAEQGVVTPISALFPSTTAASVATLSYGVLPSQHALYEWNVYIPAYGEVIQTLPVHAAGPARGRRLSREGLRPGTPRCRPRNGASALGKARSAIYHTSLDLPEVWDKRLPCFARVEQQTKAA